MEHRYIDDNDLVDHYLAGRLSAQECTDFEAHFVDCPRCQDQLELAEEFRTSMRAAAAEDARKALFQIGLLALLARWSRARQAAFAFVLVAVLALPAAWFGWEARSLRERVGLAEAMVEQIRQPQINTPNVILSLVRSADPDSSAFTPRIVADPSSPWLTLSLEVEPDESIRSYRATAEAADGRVLWTGSGIEPGFYDVVAITFPADFFPEGEYRLALEGLTEDGARIPVGRYAFRVSRSPSL